MESVPVSIVEIPQNEFPPFRYRYRVQWVSSLLCVGRGWLSIFSCGGNLKLDMDLVREILLAIEQNERMDGLHWFIYDGPEDIGIKNCSTEKLSYTIGRIAEAGLLQCESGTMLFPAIGGLTWHGHEYLDATRDPDIWEKTKAKAKGVAGVGVGVLLEIAKAEIKAKLGLS